jgi:Sec-independent protein translocase protein TatA
MFNIGFGEILVVLVVAVIVLKPKDFPLIMEKVGLQVNIVKRFVRALLQGLNH